MRKYSLFICLLLICSEGYSQNDKKIHWMTLKEATEKNKSAPKKIFMDVYTKWCGWCKQMDKTTFEDSAVINYMNKEFYAVKLDAETKDSIRFKDKSYGYVPDYKANEIAVYLLNGQMGYPTSVFLDEKMDLLGPMPGYLTKEQLIIALKYFGENIYKTKKWEDYLKEVLAK